MKPLVIAVDVDGVCADLHTAWLDRYNAIWGDNLTPDKLDGWGIWNQVKPECGEKVMDILVHQDLYDHVQPIQGAAKAVSLLRQAGHRVVFVTSCVVGSADMKAQWLQRYGFLPEGRSAHDFVVCSSKHLIRADILIDDHAGNVQPFPGTGILIRLPHNRSVEWDGISANSLLDAARLILPDSPYRS